MIEWKNKMKVRSREGEYVIIYNYSRFIWFYFTSFILNYVAEGVRVTETVERSGKHRDVRP